MEGTEGRIKTLLMDSGKLAAATAVATVKHHEPSFDLGKVKEELDLVQLVASEEIQAAADDIMKKIDL